MIGLKKAYADIILNTTKEAAARVMVSQRRALHFQNELASTKKDALRMLLRFKNMIHLKVFLSPQTLFFLCFFIVCLGS